MLVKSLFRFFETWIDPFQHRDNLQPPRSASGFIWFYVGQAKWAFAAMLVLGGTSAAIEAALFWFVGRLVDILATVKPAEGWDGLLAAHGAELFGMLALIGIVRFAIAFLIALIDQQVITPGFYNLARWQAYLYVSRQSLHFFQSDFSGRIVTKVWSAGQAAGDLVTSLMESVWFVGIYAVTTIALVGRSRLVTRGRRHLLALRIRGAGPLFRAAYPLPFARDGRGGVDDQRPHGGRLCEYPDAEALRTRRGERPLHAAGLRYFPGNGAELHALHHRRSCLDGAAVGPDDRDDGGHQRASVAARRRQLRRCGFLAGTGAAS